MASCKVAELSNERYVLIIQATGGLGESLSVSLLVCQRPMDNEVYGKLVCGGQIQLKQKFLLAMKCVIMQYLTLRLTRAQGASCYFYTMV